MLCAREFGWQLAEIMSTGLPSQCQFPGLDSTLDVIIPRGTEFDVLSPLVVEKDSLHPFVELLRKRCQVLRGVEFRTPQLLWLWVE